MYMALGTQILDITAPLSGILAVLIESSIIYYAIMLADGLLSHNIEAARVRIMAIAAYIATPILFSLTEQMFPVFLFRQDYSELLSLLLPLAIWIILGEFFLKGTALWKKTAVALLAYGIFLFFTAIRLQAIIGSYIRI